MCSLAPAATPSPVDAVDPVDPADAVDPVLAGPPPATTSPVLRPAPEHALAPRLRADWARLRRDRAAVRRARGWHVTEVDIDDLDHLLVLAGSGVDDRTGASAGCAAVLERLVHRAVDDELAARVVLQRLVPGLLTSAMRRRQPEAFEELVGAAWIAIRTYDRSRRPASLASALIVGAEHRAFKSAARRRSAGEVSAGPDEVARWSVAEPGRPDPLVELAEIVREARAAGLPDADVALVRDLVRTPSTEVLAAERGVTARTIRNHREQVAFRLRRATVAA